jgi:tRNA (guanine-N7-)-methyltransferase
MKRKLERFSIIADRENVLQPGKELYFLVKGKWNDIYFKNNNPITLELACGRGEYTIGLANKFPDRNYIGVDIKGDRLWKGSTLAVEQKLYNVAFLRTQILLIENFFEVGEADEIWLTFPDPRPRKIDVRRRLTNSRFLIMYKKLLKPEGYFRFKTDNSALFEYTLDEIQSRPDILDLQFTNNLYDSDLRAECFDIKTKYEEMFASKGEKIKYLRCRFKPES